MDEEVKDDINQKVEESYPLPQLIINAYTLLGKDWLVTKESWADAGHKIPPVMITVANRTETSARIKYAFDHNLIPVKEICNTDKTLQIDSKILDKAEAEEENINVHLNDDEKKLTQKEKAELLRLKVDTVGKTGKPGEQIQNVISVGMLSEGWDAQNVTHIMGLRAFSSQLLCEQVVGRGLRRTSYDVGEDGLFEPEYVNIFGVPFTFLPHEGGEGPPPPPPKPKTIIEPVKDKIQHEIKCPNVIKIEHIYKTKLTLDYEKVTPIELDPYESITHAELAAIIAGKPNPAALTEIDLKKIAEENRLQTIVFKIASQIYNNEKRPDWKGLKGYFLTQIIEIINNFIRSNKIVIKSDLFGVEEWKKRILIMLNMNKIVQHIWNLIRAENTEEVKPVFDSEYPIRSTGQMKAWATSKPCEWTQKSHINFVVIDSTWEATEAYVFDKNKLVQSFVKNDHLGFSIYYNYQGIIRKYYPDYIIKMSNGKNLVLEIKGQDNERNRTKRAYLKEWTKAVNTQGGFGEWHSDVSFHPSDIEGIIKKY